METPRVLVVERSRELGASIQDLLLSSSITSTAVTCWTEALNLLRVQRFAAIVHDLEDPPAEVRRFLAVVQRTTPTTPVIIVVEPLDQPGPAAWMVAGAFEVLPKPMDPQVLLPVLHRALTWSQLCGDPLLPPVAPLPIGPRPFAEIVGDSEAMQVVYHWIGKVAPADANVCLHGESGTGKELVARAIHDSGRRRGRPFVVLDCAAIPEGLMESEMFGHVRGAFTSAVGDRVGVFQLADTGTLFLDEVGELTLPLQAKLLRVIQNREFRRVGGSHPLRVDVRIIAATNRDLATLVKRGQFREDLFYRLDVISISLPPLRKRKEDIPLLVDHFVEQFNKHSDKPIRGVTARTLRLLLQYDWPGNVRELQNCIERAGVMAEGTFIDIANLHQILHPAQATTLRSDGSTLKEREKASILDALRETRGNKTAAAALLGISLRGLHYKLRRLGNDGMGTGTGAPKVESREG